MTDLFIWIGIALGVLLGVILLITLLGLFFKKAHVVGRSVQLQQAPEAIWQVIADFPATPGWHKMIMKVERLEDKNGHEVWRETYTGNYPIILETTEAAAPQRLVRSLADEKGPFRGRWEFAIAPLEQGSRLTITEFGEIPNPFFRFMARMFMNPAQYLEIYLKALGEKFGEPARIEKAS